MSSNPYFENYEQNRRLLERLRETAPAQVMQAQSHVQQFYGNPIVGVRSGLGEEGQIGQEYSEEMGRRDRMMNRLPDMVGFNPEGFGGM